MAILRLNDEEHFLKQNSDDKTKTVIGFVTSASNLLLYDDEVKLIRKVFEKLYANYLLFYAKVYEANKTQKVLEFET
jgi:hypothetical protein